MPADLWSENAWVSFFCSGFNFCYSKFDLEDLCVLQGTPKVWNCRQCVFYAVKVCNVEHLQEWIAIHCVPRQVKTFVHLHWCECWISPDFLTVVTAVSKPEYFLWIQVYGTFCTLCWNLRFSLSFKLQFCSSTPTCWSLCISLLAKYTYWRFFCF
jgi:hypothetical protein